MESFRRINIPMEILRSVVAVANTGSQSKAASLVGLSQPALSTHLKKIDARWWKHFQESSQRVDPDRPWKTRYRPGQTNNRFE